MAADSAILSELTDAYSNDVNEWADIQNEGQTDVRVLSGDVWNALDEKGAKQRRDANRPMLALDELSQYVNQVVNDNLANPLGAKFTPASAEAVKNKAADFYQNKAREIEYRSHASVAYATAFENIVTRSYGYVRVNTRYIHEGLFDDADDAQADPVLMNQELWIDAVPNPDMVLPDPYAQRADLGDMRRCFVLEWKPVADFKRDFPDARVQNFTPQNTAKAKAWFTPDRKQVLVAEYWTKDQDGTRTLLILKPGKPSKLNPNPQPLSVWRDQLKHKPDSDSVLSERKIPIMAVKQRLTNGVEILQSTDWKGRYIPITGGFGKILFVDSGAGAKKKILSMIRLARDPFMLYCYYRTCEAEVVGGIPKFPYFVYEGQLSQASLGLLAKSIKEPVAVIPVKVGVPGVTPAGQPLPFPQRNPYDGSALQYLEIGAEAARRAIQAAMGITPLPTPIQRENQKSGAALQEITSNSQRGSFHLVDALESMVRQVWVIGEDLMDKTYDTMRDTAVRDAQGNGSLVSINDPNNPASVNPSGSYQVTVSAGPSNASAQAAADDTVDGLVTQIAMVAQIAGPQVAKAVLAQSVRQKVQGPAGDQLANLIDPPPPPPGTPDPQQLAQLQQENQQLTQTVQQLKAVVQGEIAKEEAKGKVQIAVETMKANSEAALKLLMQKRELAAKIEAARITASRQTADAQMEDREEMLALGLEHAQETALLHAKQAHELGLQAHAGGNAAQPPEPVQPVNDGTAAPADASAAPPVTP